MTADVAREKLEECVNNGTLTKWEESFLTSLIDKLDRQHRISEQEQNKLEEIHRKIFR